MAKPLFAPAAARNREPILQVLRDVLPSSGRVLEIASGTGQHAAFFAENLPELEFQPSDPDPTQRASIQAWRGAGRLPNLREPVDLDASRDDWELQAASLGAWDALVCINLLHIAPWAAARGLLRGAAVLLPPGAPLMLYGPYRRAGHAMEPSNQAFDARLREQDPAWGVRALQDVVEEGSRHGWQLAKVVDMPAHNLSVVLEWGAGS